MDWIQEIRSRLPVQYIIQHWRELTPTTRALPAHLWQALINFKDYGIRQAAALSYYAVFSIFPLTLLLTVGISTFLGPTVAQEQIIQGLILFLPERSDVITTFEESVAQALQQSGSFGLIALVGLIWSALGLFSNLTSSLDRIFQVPASRSLWRQRLLAFVMTLMLIVLVITSFVASGVLRLMDALLLSNPSVWIRIGTLFLPFGINMVIFVLLFRYVPARHVSWDAVWPAAMLGGAGVELAKLAFAWYLDNLADFQLVYGGITTVIVLMLWAYLTASILLISAEICAQLNLWMLGQHETPRVRIFIESSLSRLPPEIPPPV